MTGRNHLSRFSTTAPTAKRMVASCGLALLLAASAVSAQTWTESAANGTPPAPRYDAGSAYDAASDRLILFSGSDFPVPRPNDVWVLADATSDTPEWIELIPANGAPPLGRFGGSTVYDPASNRLIVHGGCLGNCTPVLSDTWYLTDANGLGGTPTWNALPPIPVAREGHTAVYDEASNRMIVFGGIRGFPGTNVNDVWVLTDANGNGSPGWTQLAPTGTPPTPRHFARAVFDAANNRMIVFGGFRFQSSASRVYFNDVWVLTNANGLGGTPQWIELSPVGPAPASRVNHALAYDPGTNRMILFGGVDQLPDGTTVPFNDIWVLADANGLGGTPQWSELPAAGTAPIERFGHSAAYSEASNQLVIAMGRNDQAIPRYMNDIWVLDRANGLAPTPAEATGDLIEEVADLFDEGAIPSNLEGPLTTTLEEAVEKLDDGKLKPATKQLDAFINKVNAQIGNKITPEEGQALIDAAQAIIDELPSAKRAALPEGYSLSAAYPNPFNPATHIRYGLADPQRVHLAVYDALGQKVATLVDAWQHAGVYQIEWNAVGFGAGIYFYRLQAGEYAAMGKMLLVK